MDETTMTMGISPAGAERGRWVYSAWKHLRNIGQQAVAPFEATSLAGKACDLLGRMRQFAPYGPAALRRCWLRGHLAIPGIAVTRVG